MSRCFHIATGGLLVLLVLACQSRVEPPVAYFKPSKVSQSKDYVYGYGNARYEDDAKNSALHDLQTQLVLSLQTQLQRSRFDDFSTTKPVNIVPHIASLDKDVVFETIAKKQGMHYMRAAILKKRVAQLVRDGYNQSVQNLKAVSCAAPKGAGMASRMLVLQYRTLLEILGEKVHSQQPLEREIPALQLEFSVNDNRYSDVIQKEFKRVLESYYSIQNLASNTMRVDVTLEHGSKGSTMLADVVVQDCNKTVVQNWTLTSAQSTRGPYENTRHNARQVAATLNQKLKQWATLE